MDRWGRGPSLAQKAMQVHQVSLSFRRPGMADCSSLCLVMHVCAVGLEFHLWGKFREVASKDTRVFSDLTYGCQEHLRTAKEIKM